MKGNQLIEKLVQETFQVDEREETFFELVELPGLNAYWLKEKNWFFPKNFSVFNKLETDCNVQIPEGIFPLRIEGKFPTIIGVGNTYFIYFADIRSIDKEFTKAA